MGLSAINSDSLVLPNHTLACRYETFNATKRAALFAALYLLGFDTSHHDAHDHNPEFNQGVLAMLSPPDLELTEIISLVTNEARVNVLSPSLTSPIFDDEVQYPYFSRVVPSDEVEARAASLLVAHYGWKHVIVVSSSGTGEVLRTAFLAYLHSDAPDANVALMVSLPAADAEVVASRLQSVADSNVRVVINLCEPDTVDVLFQTARALNILRGRTWIHAGAVALRHEKWTDLAFVDHLDGHLMVLGQAMPSSADEYAQMMGRVLAFASPTIPPELDYVSLFSEILSTETAVRLLGCALDRITRDKRTCAGADSEALTECQRLTFFDGDDDAILRFYLRNTSIPTLFGPLQMDAVGNAKWRVLLLEVSMAAALAGELGGARTIAGVADLSAEVVNISPNATGWVAGLSEPPSDIARTVYKRKFIPMALRGCMTALAVLGMAFALACLWFLHAFRTSPIVYMSSVKMNCITITGAMLALSMVVVTALGTASDANCRERHILLLAGFALMYAPLFAKTWRVHQIFNSKKLRVMRIRDPKLAPLILFLLAVGLVIGFVFACSDSMRVERAEVGMNDGTDAVHDGEH